MDIKSSCKQLVIFEETIAEIILWRSFKFVTKKALDITVHKVQCN